MRRYSGPRDLDGQLRLASRLAQARYAIPWQYRDNEGDILAVMQHAIALDIELAVALDNLHFSDTGAGGMRGRLMAALLTRAGHEIVPLNVSPRLVRMRLVRGDGRRSGGAQWTLAEAQSNDLLARKGSPWRGYGEDMLWWRCLSRVARRYAADVILGFYAAEELDDVRDDGARYDTIDLDGNPEPAPDVATLLAGLADADLETVRNRWSIAAQEGFLDAYAGTVDGVTLLVRDVLYELADKAEEREMRAAGIRREDMVRRAVEQMNTTGAPTTQDLTDVATDTGAAPAGTGGPLACGCLPAQVFASGGHGEGCTRPRPQPPVAPPAPEPDPGAPAVNQRWLNTTFQPPRPVRVMEVGDDGVVVAPLDTRGRPTRQRITVPINEFHANHTPDTEAQP